MRTVRRAAARHVPEMSGSSSIKYTPLQDLVTSSPRVARLRSMGPAPVQAYSGKLAQIAGRGAQLAAAVAAEMDAGSIDDPVKRQAMLDRHAEFARQVLADDKNADITFYAYFFRLCEVVARENRWDVLDDEEEAENASGDISGDAFSDDDFSIDDIPVQTAMDAEDAVGSRGEPKWASDDTGTLNAKRALKKRLKRFHKYSMTVLPHEYGQTSFSDLMKDSAERLAALPVAEEDMTDSTQLLSRIESTSRGSGASASAAAHALVGLEDEGAAAAGQSGDFENEGDEHSDLASIKDEARFIDKIIAKARGRFIKGNSRKSQLLLVALSMAQQELHNLRKQHKGLRSALIALGVGGPATYLEEKILPVVSGHMPTHIKEFVPPGTGRKRRGAVAGGAEGVTDMGWNIGTAVTDVFSGGAASLITAGVGAGYKAGYAASAANRAGASAGKVEFLRAATALFEFLQGLIPFYSGVVGTTGGARGLYKAINPLKRLTKMRMKRKGFQSFKNEHEGGGPVDAMFESRIARGKALLAEAASAPGSQGTDRLVVLVRKDVEFLQRQLTKLEKREE